MSFYDDCNICKHLLHKVIEKDWEKMLVCKAFPDGIPGKYRWYSSEPHVYGLDERDKPMKTKPHNKVVPGQVGNYVFEETDSFKNWES